MRKEVTLDCGYDTGHMELDVTIDNVTMEMPPRLNPDDENLGVNYVERNGHYVVDGDMVLSKKTIFTGNDTVSGKQIQYIVLTNDSDVTWEKVDRKYHSDGFGVELSGTIIIGRKEIE